MLTLVVGLRCVGFINPVDVAGVWRQRLSLFVGHT
jgi:hypothetical protein